MKIFRVLVILSNLAFFMFVLVVGIYNLNDPRTVHDLAGFFGYLLIILFPILNLTYFYLAGASGENWISLYIERKKAEERKKIRDLNKTE